jgi:hypothetical protein
MNSNIMHQIVEMIESEAHSRPSPIEFEMAYQARVAMDRIRFAIRHTEQFGPHTDQMRETGIQLLEALQRLEMADRRFQARSRAGSGSQCADEEKAPRPTNGQARRSSHEPSNI